MRVITTPSREARSIIRKINKRRVYTMHLRAATEVREIAQQMYNNGVIGEKDLTNAKLSAMEIENCKCIEAH